MMQDFYIAAAGNPEDFARTTGSVIALLAILAGMVKCLTLLRRPATNKVCVIALSFVLLGWLSGSTATMLGQMLPEVSRALSIFGGLAMVFFSLVGCVLAVVGLATYDGTRQNQGRAQAVWSLIIGVAFVGIATTAAVLALDRDEGAGSSVSGKVLSSDKFNCSLTGLSGWVETKPAQLNALACIAMMRSGPEAYAMVLGEEANMGMDIEGLMEAVKSNLSATGSTIEDSATDSLTLGATPFMRHTCVITSKATKNVPMYFEQWVTARPGYAWQIHLWGAVKSKQVLIPQFRSIVESFRVLDPTRTGSPDTQLQNVARPEWGYRTGLPATEWSAWKSDNELANFGALRAKEGLTILPVALPDDKTDVEAIAAGLLGRFDIPYPSDEGWVSKKWTTSWGDGLEITGSREVDGDAFDYILRVVRHGRVAHLHAGWATHDKGDLKRVRAGLDRIELTTPSGTPPPPSADQKASYALFCNDVGIALYNQRDYRAATPWFKLAFDHNSQDAAMLGNFLDVMRETGKVRQALDFLKPHRALADKSPSVLLHEAYLHADDGDFKAGEAAFERSIQAGLKDENKALTWFQELSGAEEYALAEKATTAWKTKFPTINARRWHAQTVASAGDAKKSIELFEALSKEYPDDRRVTYDLAEALNDTDEYERAAEIAERLLADGKDNTRALMVLGWSQMGRKWYREAKVTFEKAAAKAPDDESVKNALRRASAMLGQGNNSDIKTVIEPVPIPAEIEKVIAANPPAADYGSDQPMVWLVSATGMHFDPEKPLRQSWHRRVKVLTVQGANSLSSVEYAFDPLSERIHINKIEVRDETGALISTKNLVDDAYVMDIDDGNGTHRKKLHFQVPGLRPGYTLDYTVTRQDLSPQKTFPFQRHHFSDGAAEIVFVTGPALDQVLEAPVRTEALQIIRQRELRAWIGLHMPFDQAEPYGVFYEDRVPGLTLGGKEGTWSEIGVEYLKDIENRLKLDDEIKALTAALTQGASGDREKIARLARHVQKEISYTAIEFGTRARRPNTAAHTLEKHYGDCKDQALLLHQLLRAADVESHLALVSTEWRVQPTLPNLDQFNHMVVHVPALGEGRLIDTTSKSLHLAAWQADDLWHSHALILDPKKPRLAPPKLVAEPGSAVVESHREVLLEGDVWKVTETLTAKGYYGAWLRGAFVGLDKPQQLRKAQTIMEKQGRLHLDEVRFDHLDDPAQPARLHLTYDVPDAVLDDSGGHRSVLPALWERDYLGTTFVKNRRTGFYFVYPFQMRTTMTFSGVPAAFASSLKSLENEASGVHASHHLKVDVSTPSKPELRFDFQIKAGAHPASEYARWHREWNAALRAWEKPVQWKD